MYNRNTLTGLFSFNNQKRLRFWRFLFFHQWALNTGGSFTGFRLLRLFSSIYTGGVRLNAGYFLAFQYYVLSSTFAIAYSLSLVRAR